MKALKIITTALLSMLLLASGIAAEAVALVNCTVLNPAFYGSVQSRAYDVIGRFVVRELSDTVLERVPVIALRTTNRERAYELAADALKPAQVAGLLKSSGPEIAEFLLHGGDVPVLKGIDGFASGQAEAIKSLIMEEFWHRIPTEASLPAFLPFSPEWNSIYAQPLSEDLWLARYYLSFRTQALLLAQAAVTLAASLLYLLWVRDKRPFFITTGVLLCVNSLLLILPAALVAYWTEPMAWGAAAYWPVSEAAALFSTEYAALVRAALWPFREIFFISSLTSMSLGLTMFTVGLPARTPQEALALGPKGPHAKSRKTGDLREAVQGRL